MAAGIPAGKKGSRPLSAPAEHPASEHPASEHPVCPHCGATDPDWWEGAPETAGPGSCWDDACRACRGQYRIEMTDDAGFVTRAISAGGAPAEG